MYYAIEQGRIIDVSKSEWEDSIQGICVFDEDEWCEELKLQEEFSLTGETERIFFCKLEKYASHLFGTFRIPVKKRERRNLQFVIYILQGKLIFVDEENYAREIIRKMQKQVCKRKYSLREFLSDFFMEVTEEDVLYLAALERELAEMEDAVLQNDTRHFNYHMLGIKKEISRLYCYYSQMTDVGEFLLDQGYLCELFVERIRRLQQEMQSLREYAMQVQDVYQAQIAIHQNDIMKLLTVVTTIFLPLTLIAGWYGMNFYNMPELNWKYGYSFTAGISLLIVVICLWIFKKKKFF